MTAPGGSCTGPTVRRRSRSPPLPAPGAGCRRRLAGGPDAGRRAARGRHRGATVAAGQVLVVIEAMKMEHQVVAPGDGDVAEVMVAPGDQVEAGQVLLRLTTA